MCKNNKVVQEDIQNYKKTTVWLQALFFLLGLAGLNVLAFIFAFIFKLFVSDNATFNMLINTCTYSTLFVVFIVLVVIYSRHLLNSFKHLSLYLFGILGFVIMIALSNRYGILVQDIPGYKLSGNETNVRTMIDAFPFISVIVVGFLGPICEELTYRVGLFDLVRRYNKYLAYAITIIVFAFLHFEFGADDLWVEFLNLPFYIIGGVALTCTYHKFGLAASLTAHIINNLISVLSNIF